MTSGALSPILNLMNQVRQWPLILIAIFSGGLLLFKAEVSHAREVSSLEEEIRLSGWNAFWAEKKALEKLRLSDESNIKKNRLEWERAQEAALKDYRLWKAKQAKNVDELGPEYAEYLRDRLADQKEQEGYRRSFVEEQERRRRAHRLKVQLSEEVELGIVDDSVRVAWRERKLLPKGGSSNPAPISSSPSGGDFGPPPPPPPPDFFDSDMPPPPPPPPVDSGFNNFNNNFEDLPPPPPPIFDDELPPF